MARARCESCGQTLPTEGGTITARELDVLTEWFLTGSVVQAARNAGVGQQRAKNMLRAARIRNGVSNNDQLMGRYYEQVIERMRDATSHKIRMRQAA